MPRHRFDPVALVFGAVFVAGGTIVLAGGELIEEGRALVPAGLIALGVALLVHVGRRARPPAPAGAVAEPTPRVASDRDLDTLFAPVDDALADWDRIHAGVDTAATDPTEPGVTATDATDVDATEVVDTTDVDATEVETTPTDATDVDATDVDATEVVDPTERYPRPEPQ
ncbi:MAG TPA: hypothetical protein VIZ67_07160 [Acidimicrobiales bacterium]